MKKYLIICLSLCISGCITLTKSNTPNIESDPIEKAESRITLGLGYLENGNMAKGRENLEKALEHAPKYYRSMLSIAHYYEIVGETDKARDAYEDALSEHDDNGNVLNNYGAFLCKHRKYQQADDYFNEAVEQANYYLVAESYENAGLCALKSGNLTKAEQYFNRALDHNPQRVPSLLQLSKLEIESGRYTDARIRLITFNKKYGNHDSSLKLLAELEKRAGNKVLVEKYRSRLSRHH